MNCITTSTTLSVRPTTEEDFDAADSVLRSSYPTLLKNDYSKEVMETVVPVISGAQPKLVASGTYYIVEDAAGTPVGVGGWTPNPKQPEVADIRHLATHPAHTRRGVGRALMEHIYRTAEAAGIKRFDCTATLTAVPFYQSVGFKKIAPTAVEFVGGVLMGAMTMERRAS